jgi:hypothetical protein
MTEGNGPAALGVHLGSGRDGTGVVTAVGVTGPDVYGLAAAGRWELDLAAGGTGQLYHRARHLGEAEGQRLVTSGQAEVRARAEQGLRQIIRESAMSGVVIGCVAVPVDLDPDRAAVPLAQIVASHSLIHVAEAALYHEGLARAADAVGVPVVRFDSRSGDALSAVAVAGSPEDVDDIVRRFGAELGRPWRRSHRDAAAAALIAWSRIGS